jgi:hypothetical protein
MNNGARILLQIMVRRNWIVLASLKKIVQVQSPFPVAVGSVVEHCIDRRPLFCVCCIKEYFHRIH